MSKMILLHNPKAGDEAHSAERLQNLIRQEGYECRYYTTDDEGWKQPGTDTKFVAVAGGDGTVRQVAQNLLKLQSECTPAIAIIPSGTANNIATSLHIGQNEEEVIKSWKSCRLIPVDTGLITGIPDQDFFIESMGFGVLPSLMQAMEKADTDHLDTPEKEIQLAKDLLYNITLSYPSQQCRVVVDGQDYSGRYLLVEVLNIAFVGPNLHLAPVANPSDAQLEVMLVSENRRDEFAAYIREHQNSDDAENLFFKPIKGRHVELQWEGYEGHVDDEVVQLKEKQVITVSVNEGALQFLL